MAASRVKCPSAIVFVVPADGVIGTVGSTFIGIFVKISQDLDVRKKRSVIVPFVGTFPTVRQVFGSNVCFVGHVHRGFSDV